ncbi:MAG: polyhydroxyalkanoate synthesis regulator DNA-binding domain-containing protein [Pirellulaceae bacterium]|nr:hypothetical protein [Planctomycetales bacterium]MCA9265190.1 hypothetical protein [Planctomycetales bacterium]
MADEPVLIKRYPNRRFYARHESKYVSLADIEQMIADGLTVEIRDSQTGEDLTRSILTQIIMDRHPDKMSLFPVDMLHFILRANDVSSGFLRNYFRDSLTFLEYLQQRNPSTATMPQPMHWMQAWLDRVAKNPNSWMSPASGNGNGSGEPVGEVPPDGGASSSETSSAPTSETAPSAARATMSSAAASNGDSEDDDDAKAIELARRLALLEERIRQLEGADSSQ